MTQAHSPSAHAETDLRAIADTAEAIYNERYREEYERAYPDQFVVIDARDGSTSLGVSPVDALQLARDRAPDGVFHLIRIGFSSVCRMSYVE